MRPIDADHLTTLVTNSTILSEGFKDVFCRLVNGEPTVIRCSDCVYFRNDLIHFCDRLDMDLPDDSGFFCAYGEKEIGRE